MQKQLTKVLKSSLIFTVIALAVLAAEMPNVLAKEAKAPIDLNTADQKALESLPGVGPATAKKIIENRPYKSVDELSRAGIPAKTVDKLKPFVTTTGAAAKTPQLPKTETKLPQIPAVAGKAAAKGTAKIPTGPIDLNTADQKALESLPGVGPATAAEIIKGRPYKSVEDIGKIKGMSKGKIEKLKGLATVSQIAEPSVPSGKVPPVPSVPAAAKPAKSEIGVPKTPSGIEKKAAAKLLPGEKVNINTASKEMLEALPGIGPAKAQAIIEGRPYNSPEDIMKVKGIKQGTFSKIKDQITVK